MVTGLWKSKVIDIPGKDLDGVVSAIDFLKDARLNKENMTLGDTVLVIGGGDVAMDCVTTDKTAGCKS